MQNLRLFSLSLTFLALLGCLLGSAKSQYVDDTLVPETKGYDVSEAVVRKIQRAGIFHHDQKLLRRLAFVESRDGEDPKTYRPNYHGGIWQLDENKFNLTKNQSNLQTYYQEINRTLSINWNNETVTWSSLRTPLYSGIAARLYMQYLDSSNGIKIPGTINTQAAYWVQHYRPEGNPSHFIDLVKTLESDYEAPCEGVMDICIVLDGSGSIEEDNFDKARNFTRDLVSSFTLGSTRVGFVLYSTTAVKIFDLNNNLTAAQMNVTINNIPYPANRTNTPAGLLMAVDFFKNATERPGIPKVVATFTDGNTNEGNLVAAVQAVRNASLASFAIGIGPAIDDRELLQIAINDPSRVFMVNDYDALVEFFRQMNQEVCEVPIEPELGDENNNGTLALNERRYFKFEIPENGLSLRLETGGNISGWFSYTEPTPNSALCDGTLDGVTFIERQAEGQGIDVFVALQSKSQGSTHYKLTPLEGDHTNGGARFQMSNGILFLLSFLMCFRF